MPKNPLESVFQYTGQFDKFGRVQPLPSATTPNPEAEAQRQRDRDFAIDVHVSPGPDDVAKTTRVARQAGVEPGLIEDRVDATMRGINIKALTDQFQKYPVIGKFFGDNPRAAVTAQDDARAMGTLGKSWAQSVIDEAMGRSDWFKLHHPFLQAKLAKAPRTAQWVYEESQKAAAKGDMKALDKIGVMAPQIANLEMAYAPASGYFDGAADQFSGKGLLGAFKAGLASSAGGVVGGGESTLETVGSLLAPGIAFSNALMGTTIDANPLKQAIAETRTKRKTWGLVADQYRPQVESRFLTDVYSGVESVPTSLTAAGVTLATRNPYAGAAMMGATTFGQSYGAARDEGLSVWGANAKSLIDATLEVATELGPEKALAKLSAETPLGKFVVDYLGKEVVGEQIATVTQDFNQWASIDANKGKTFSDYLSEVPDHAISTLTATLTTSGALTAFSTGIRRTERVADKVIEKVKDAREAKRSGALIDNMAKAAEQSKLRERDPEAYADLVRSMANENGVSHVYVPGSVAIGYFQSDAYDPDSDVLRDYYTEAFDAAEHGGDIILPVELALGTLPGTPAWAALKDDMRLTGGGMSQREADDFQAHMDDEIAALGEQVAHGDAKASEGLSVQQALIDQLAAKLQNAGERPYTARAYAELIVQKESTRAARLGQELQGNELDNLNIRQVLPPALAEAKRADATDLVINALRKGKDAAVYDGPSLIEWIAKNGGIWDGDPNSDFKGGDFKAMGLGNWHRAKKGRRKAIRDPKQGHGGRGADRVLVDAIEAGYFPELQGYDTAPDAGVLHDAINAELSGSPRYASEARIDPMRAAAEELSGLLRERGLDPEGMSDAELRAVIAQLDEAGAGQGYDQLPDMIEIDGVQRPTRNSVGMPIAGPEEGVRAFWKWFGESKVVDEEGRPLVVFHGTDEKITKVNLKKGAQGLFWFSSDRDKIERGDAGAAGRTNIMELYAKIERPADWGEYDRKMLFELKRDYDGALLTERDGSFDGFILNEATQIKSINNRGTFDPGDARILYQPAYHGSPHIFDKFSLDKIGTGEGAQVYGWGLYFAGKREIAEHYRRALSLSQNNYAASARAALEEYGAPIVENNAEYQGSVGTVASLQRAGVEAEAGADGGAVLLRMAPELRGVVSKDDAGKIVAAYLAKENKGRLYQVEIPEDDEYLLWDKPLSEQPEKVRDALDKGLKDYGTSLEEIAGIVFDDGDVSKLTGERIYWKLVDFGGIDGQERASTLLHNAGIAGIKYLHGTSRADGEGSFNYVVFDDSRVSIQTYEQYHNDGPRGRILFDQGQRTIELFQNRNLSTVIHELSHMWLEDLRIDAESPNAPEQLKQDWQTVQDWFAQNGHPVTGGIIPTEAHELWARTGERYTMEGKSPTPALQRLFETFRGWLISIYKKVDALRAPITPEIRSVFDRLIATDEEIATMAERQALEPLFKDAATIGMSDAEHSAYASEVQSARDDASGALLAKTMSAVKARVTKEYNDQRHNLESEITEAVNQRPLFRAFRVLKDNPISAKWIRDEMGADAFDLMPRRVPPVYKDGGTHPDTIAEMAGYSSGRDMIEALIGAEAAHRQAREGGDQRTLRVRTIAEETDAEMRSRHGDPFTDGSIEREALAAVHNEKQGEVFAAEARALARKTGQRPTPYRIAREWARRRVRQGTYAAEASPSAIQRHARNAAKAGRDAEKSYLAGKFDEALRFKQQQMVSSALLAEAKEANDEAEAARKRMDKVARRVTSKSVDQDYLDQAHALLESVDLRERTQKSLDRLTIWAEWSQARANEGFDIVVPTSFAEMIAKTNWSRLPLEQLLGLDAAVGQIMHLGRLKQTLLDNKERRDFDELVQEARNGGDNMDGPPPADLMEPGWWDSIKAGVAAADAALLKMETVFDWLDGGNPNGVFNRIAFRPIAEAQGREQDMLKDYYGRIKVLFEAVPGEVTQRWTDTVSPPFINRETGLPERLRRQQLIAVALNIGNEGNLQRLTDGHGWNREALLEYLNSELTAEEWQLAQGIWDTIDTLWPAIEALEKQVNGVAPEKVEPREIETPHGTFRGGYYPAVYDSTKNRKAKKNADEAAGLFEGNYTRATTRSSATKARLDKVSQPILLQLGVINRHLGEVIHDITHREPVMQAHKFLTDSRVEEIVDRALGRQITDQLRPWVKFVANSWAIDRAGNEGIGKWMGKLRANVTAVGMGLRASTMLTQIAGYSNSFEVVGEAWVSAAIVQTTAHPIESFNFVLGKSSEVRGRMDNLDRDIRTELARLSASNPASKASHAVLEGRKFFFHGIGYMDRVVVVPTWIGAYNKALSEGMSEDNAIYTADKAVRVSQGSGAPKDMAAIQRGTGKWGEALKLMTMFYSYFSAMYQRERTLGRDVMGSDTRRPRNMPRLASRAFWLLVVPPLLTEAIKMSLGGGDPPDDDEWWTQWVARKMISNALGPIPLARDVFEPAWDGARGGQTFNPQITPVNRALMSVVDSAKDIGKIARGDEHSKATRHILETAGYATGLVPGQVASAAQFLVDVGDGDASPETFADWVQGLSTGKLAE